MLDLNPHTYALENADELDSPALLVYEERLHENLRRMVSQAGGPERLCPHVKTHKLPQVIARQVELGVHKFKAATIAEAEMCAAAGAPQVLLAHAPVGPRAERLLALVRAFPKTGFATIVDDPEVARYLSGVVSRAGLSLEVLLDIDCGMHRSGIAPGSGAEELYRLLSTLPGLRAVGLHAYDGHIHDTDLGVRRARCEEALGPVLALRDRLRMAGLPVMRLVTGGTPTFPLLAARSDVECSPGTSVLWDYGYATTLPDLNYLCAAALLTRVTSRPLPNRLCLDLGHKAVGSEMPQPRVIVLGLEDAQIVGHSEEHLVLETERAADYPPGSVLYALPWHICPTVNLHSEVVLVQNRRATSRWPVVARSRRISL
ncbi:MAG TPA: D-TA family PLP-dependent enzyme [Polyangiaceae bacterium]|jgi:D-serine deaminase-like pyridoxal phosphate-dependent protein